LECDLEFKMWPLQLCDYVQISFVWDDVKNFWVSTYADN
jgi:hypothetical protein